MGNWFAHYGKSLAAALMLVVTATQAGLSDNHLTQAEYLEICIAVATAVSVYAIPNMAKFPQSKTVVAMILSGLEVAVTLVDNGVSSADWTAIVLGALTAASVAKAPAVVHLPKAAASGATTVPLKTTADVPIKDV